MLWAVFVILGSFLFAIVNILDKFVITKESRDPLLASVIAGLVSFFLFSIISFVYGDLSVTVEGGVAAFLAGALYPIARIAYYSALKHGDITKVSPLFAAEPLFVVVIAFFFLAERFNFINYLGIGLVIVGVILISYNPKVKVRNLKAMAFVGLIAAFIYAVRTVIVKYATLQDSVWSIFIWMGFGSLFVSAIILSIHHPHLRKKAKKGLKHLVLIDSLVIVGVVLAFIGLSLGTASLAIALEQVRPLFVFLMMLVIGIFNKKFVKDDFSKKVLIWRGIATLVIFIGAILVTMT